MDAVIAARSQGVEAYYYHGEMASLVCIGAWPETAVKVNDEVRASNNADPMQTMLVVPMTADPEVNRQFDRAAEQGNMQLVRQQVRIIDPTLEAALKQFPHNTLNGLERKRTVQGKEVYDSSLIRRIPHDQAPPPSYAGQAPEGQPQYDPNYRPELPRQVPQEPAPKPRPLAPPGGRLRSIGD